MLGKFIVPAFAVFSVAAASTASVCSQSTATIASQADATALASCSTISGDVVVTSAAAGVISIDGPEQITGSLIVNNASALTSLESTTLNAISGNFTLTSLTLLSTLSMTSLTSVGSIDWVALPALTGLTFPATVSQATDVTISNTFLNTLDGINLNTVSTLQIDNNRRLTTFSTQVANITTSLNIASNGESLAVSFPNLIWAASMTFRNISTVSIPSLAVVNGSLGFYGNLVPTIAAPNLTAVGSTADRTGSLAIDSNTELANLSLPMLATVGGTLQVQSNDLLNTLNLPLLTTVGGAVEAAGNFSSVTFADVTNVEGAFNVTSSSAITSDCATFKKLKSNGDIQGTYTCNPASGTSGSSGSGTSTSSSSSSTSTKGAAASFGISEAAAGLSIFSGLLSMLL